MQAKDRELTQAQQQLRQLRQQVIFTYIVYYETRADCEHWTSDCLSVYMQEQLSRREIGDLERQLRSSEALVADFQLQKTLQQRDSELETLRSKVGPPSPDSLPPNSQCMNTAHSIAVLQ